MKVRSGFVSNSSSSSFLLAYKGKKPIPEDLLRMMGADPKSLAGSLLQPFAKELLSGAYLDAEKIASDAGYNTIKGALADGYKHEGLGLIDLGWDVLETKVSNEDNDGISQALHESRYEEIAAQNIIILHRSY